MYYQDIKIILAQKFFHNHYQVIRLLSGDLIQMVWFFILFDLIYNVIACVPIYFVFEKLLTGELETGLRLEVPVVSPGDYTC